MSHIQAKFQTKSGPHGRHRISSPKPPRRPSTPRLPHVTKLMALAIRLEHLLATGQVRDQAEIAGITRARVTQILNLTNLAPDIQQAILDLEPTTDRVPRFREGEIRQIAIAPNWATQRKAWKRLVNRRNASGAKSR